MKRARKAKILSILCAGLVTAAAFWKLGEPSLDPETLGVALLAVAVCRWYCYGAGDLYGLAYSYGLTMGFLNAAAGLLLILRPETLGDGGALLAGLVLADACFQFQTALESRRFGIRLWPLLALGAATAVAVSLWAVEPGLPAAAAAADGLVNLLTILLTVRIPAERGK